MIHRIDRAAVWLFAAASAFILMLVITNGRIILSVLSAFAVICLIRLLVQRIPLNPRSSRKKRLHYIESLLKKWALCDQKDALIEIYKLLPNLFEENTPDSHRILVQFLPDSTGITANHLAQIWHRHRACSELLVISTCPADSAAFRLLTELNHPSVRLIDSRRLTDLLLAATISVPTDIKKEERRVPVYVRIAHFAQDIRPVRTGLYCCLFLFLYLLTKSWFYLAASVLHALLISFYLCFRKCLTAL